MSQKSNQRIPGKVKLKRNLKKNNPLHKSLATFSKALEGMRL